MAVILVDSCVITDLCDPYSSWYEWSANTLEQLDPNHTFVINPIIYTECSIGFETIEEVENLIAKLAFDCKAIPREALFLAGKAFLHYRRRKGKKDNVLPDFFIGAHAAVKNYKLITRDKGRFSTYFPTVDLIMPGANSEPPPPYHINSTPA
ncbi:type II toxin-antitoxin system VapC family toxin [Pseudomaricurvus alcaniphilus]|uniref:type II toxin-antitoxin system VapC family toxin n=1 Tax=Pseudomaricurvus alcaniphilus TaxID=1166482 RepID=UPI00140C4CFF|nr:type II toxin-antitoxin system VapC family toxin [Pseudomaricurvus alcaniphilus]NHN39775.1 type II toxin-antitoxin system VapC family toxin [Pseudomaricurvus alcaniphilus]